MEVYHEIARLCGRFVHQSCCLMPGGWQRAPDLKSCLLVDLQMHFLVQEQRDHRIAAGELCKCFELHSHPGVSCL